ncbi:MAG: EAL domain-containing protein [Betaproteobacteria bacterium]|nr:MAG: EAL domain-containing protein [Betaproteobacteria bacterium]
MSLEYPVDDRFLERMDSELAGWPKPAERLRQALAQNEFELYCQPILAFGGSERYPMAEVLVRMREEERALLPPGEFLPVFEHYAMMPQLDRWVVTRVIERLARGSRVPRFTINVSGQTLQDAQFVIHVGTQTRKAGVAPASLLFEIDESDVLTRLEAAVRFANAIKAVGCGLLIDGFGRRAVSFTPLKALRVDYVKVDGGIVRKLLTSEVARTKMNAMVRVAEALGIGLVAECVEEQDILLRLKALNVSHAQGFGVYQPHPLDSIAAPAAT